MVNRSLLYVVWLEVNYHVNPHCCRTAYLKIGNFNLHVHNRQVSSTRFSSVYIQMFMKPPSIMQRPQLIHQSQGHGKTGKERSINRIKTN